MGILSRDRDPGRFFSAEDERRIAAAIARAEENTSGEIRVHLARRAKGGPLVAARRAFERLGMDRTRLRNAVLIHIAVADRRFAIYGDTGIDAATAAGGWDAIRDGLAARFAAGDFALGVCEAVERVGETLKAAFPAGADNPNELPDGLSTDDDPGRS